MEIKVFKQIMSWNQDVSDRIKEQLNKEQIFMINIMGSPGTGKTTLITALIEALRERYNLGVIEADIAGEIDARHIGQLNIPVVQLQTDGACHIEAMAVEHMLPSFDLQQLDVLLVENIGNLVCPAEFDLGEDLRLAILSIPEGDDKVEKYPLLFSRADALLLNKYDMKPYFDFDDDRVIHQTYCINPNLQVFKISSRSKEGLERLTEWLIGRISAKLGK